jgi:hypothetical protein
MAPVDYVVKPLVWMHHKLQQNKIIISTELVIQIIIVIVIMIIMIIIIESVAQG